MVQLDIAWEDRVANHAKVEQLLRAQRPEPGSLIVLPEMFATGFSMNVGSIVDADRSTERFMQSIAREHQCHVLGGLVQRRLNSTPGRNCALAVNPQGEVIANYCKLHPFSLGGEARHFEAGEQVVTLTCGVFTVAPFVCYDLRFPEIFRSAVRRGANLFCVIANWPDTRIEHWITLLRARAIENQAYVVGVNRVGCDPSLRYPGRSLCVDPMGKLVLDAQDRQGVFSASITIDEVTNTRDRFPFLRDMRDANYEHRP